MVHTNKINTNIFQKYTSINIYVSDEDGCITDFENTAAFSREYQESQECMCDSEHMFDCGRSNTGTKHSVDVDELVRKLQVIYIYIL